MGGNEKNLLRLRQRVGIEAEEQEQNHFASPDGSMATKTTLYNGSGGAGEQGNRGTGTKPLICPDGSVATTTLAMTLLGNKRTSQGVGGGIFSTRQVANANNGLRRVIKTVPCVVTTSLFGLVLFFLIPCYWAGNNNLHKLDSRVLSSESGSITDAIIPPTFLAEAVESCLRELKTSGVYPSSLPNTTKAKERVFPPNLFLKIAEARLVRWYRSEKTYYTDFIRMIDHKLGGYLLATKLGVLSPKVLFCGLAKDLPKDMSTLGKSYVIKPLRGASAEGVKVVKDGVDILSGGKVSYAKIVKEYSNKQAIVEELIESSLPKYENLVPPDYKFHVYEGLSEIMWFVDRNKDRFCKDYYDTTVKGWRFMEEFFSHEHGELCPTQEMDGQFRHYLTPGRKKALSDAVALLSSKIGPNWLRIDMFDSKHGPVLGEFTTISAMGDSLPLEGCVMSYLFIAHGKHAGFIDDTETLQMVGNSDSDEVKESLRKMSSIVPSNEGALGSNANNTLNLAFSPEEIRKWNGYTELEKCNVVRKAQRELNLK